MKRLLLSSLLLCGMLLTAAPLQADEAADQYNLAVGLYKQKRWALSSEAFGTFVEKHPKHSRVAAAKLYWGLAFVKQQNHTKAREVLRNFVVEHAESKYLVDAMYQLAECSYLLKDYPAAQAEFERLLEKYPDHALAEWAHNYLGDAQLRTNLPEAALKTFEQAQTKFPAGRMQEEIQFGLARSYAALNRAEEAAAIYQQLSRNPQGAKAEQSLLNLGTLYYSQKQYPQSIDTFKLFEQRYPQSEQLPTARLNIGFGLFQLKDFQNAIPQFELTAQSPAYAARARYWKAHCFKSLKDYSTASEQFKTLAKGFVDQNTESSLAPLVFYHWADSEQRLDHLKNSQKIFLQVVDNWPKHKLAPNALHYATLATFQSGDEKQTADLLDRFDKQFPESGLKQRQKLLRGRWWADKGTDEALQTAQTLLTEIREITKLPRTKALAGLHLAHVLTQRKQSEPASTLLSTLLKEEKTSLHPDELKDALYLAGLNQKQQKQYTEATASFNQYLSSYPEDERVKQIQIELLQIYALSGQTELMRSTFETLKAGASQPVNLEGLRQTAESAYDEQQWQQALTLFTLITELTKDNPVGNDLSGLAWAQYKLEDKQAAAVTFGLIQKQFPENADLAPEAGYMLAKCLEEQTQNTEARAAYQSLYEKWAPQEPATSKEANTTGATSYAYLSGLNAARLAKQSNEFPQANDWYQRLTQTFPANEKLDQILDEWAMMNVEQADFSQADAIFTQLVQKRPESPLADNARLSLAESRFIAGETEEAKQEFLKLTQSPEVNEEVKESALYQLVNIANAQKDWTETVEMTGQFSVAFPQSEHLTKVLLIRATALFESGDQDTCADLVTSLKKEIAVEQQPASLWLLSAELEVHKKEYARAVEILDDFRAQVQLREDLSGLYLAEELRGRIAKNQALFDEARAAFQKVLEDEQGRQSIVGAKSQFFIAETYMTQKRYKEAQENYLKVYLLHKDFPEFQAPALYQTGLCDEALGEPEKAAQTYQKLIQEFPDSSYKSEAEERLRVVETGQTE